MAHRSDCCEQSTPVLRRIVGRRKSGCANGFGLRQRTLSSYSTTVLTDHRCTGWAWPAFRELVKVGASCTHLADDAGDRAAPPAPTLRHAGVDTRGNARGNQICAFTNWPCISSFHNLFRYPVSQFFSVESAIFPMNLATYGIRAEPASAVPPARRQQGLGLNYSA